MSTSVLLFLALLGVGVLIGAAPIVVSLRAGDRLREAPWGVAAGVVAFSALFGWGAYALDSVNARTTLFEVVAEGSRGVRLDDPAAPVRFFDVVVEHPGVEHTVLVNPVVETEVTDDAGSPAELIVRLDGPSGRSYIDEPVHHDVECRRSSCGWVPWYGRFTPAEAGVHRLAVTVVTIDVPKVHVRVEDPEKSDGERAPGY
ncbi:hypothetical protein [Pseudonocardia humida]|uniref:Uncharacterized protein n=1 Tax=Pseudonocardia humida TaxID=2800819 RepID=A0ABT1AB92_9PSEU|nr:hypothetical protein [Pseudonocardia humida]MCO1660201.1 hypothetical protein [Pseudonocardia humida]